MIALLGLAVVALAVWVERLSTRVKAMEIDLLHVRNELDSRR